ncbi:MAG: hypothetical protein FWC91_01460, partial [Defluviitaleaceae bacterium]|nr:hypothetical protein [Defluviitaleaceae bacterium]
MKNLVKKASITLMASIITLGSAPHIVLGTYEDMDNYTAYDTEAYYLSDTENMYYEDGVLNDYISYDVEVHYYRYPLSEDPYHEDVSISFEEELELVRNDPTMTE